MAMFLVFFILRSIIFGLPLRSNWLSNSFYFVLHFQKFLCLLWIYIFEYLLNDSLVVHIFIFFGGMCFIFSSLSSQRWYLLFCPFVVCSNIFFMFKAAMMRSYISTTPCASISKIFHLKYFKFAFKSLFFLFPFFILCRPSFFWRLSLPYFWKWISNCRIEAAHYFDQRIYCPWDFPLLLAFICS